jgi:hypothetical protein
MPRPEIVHGNIHQAFFDYILEELIVQPVNSPNHVNIFVAAIEASIQFSAILPMTVSAITSSSQPVLCNNSHSNSNNITKITNITSLENTGLVDARLIVLIVMLLGGEKW